MIGSLDLGPGFFTGLILTPTQPVGARTVLGCVSNPQPLGHGAKPLPTELSKPLQERGLDRTKERERRRVERVEKKEKAILLTFAEGMDRKAKGRRGAGKFDKKRTF
ncbi:hypothetical protein ElyMa_001958200 [Elysia marginata]|uniref:Uncharacterized protein n=1 Tax=Elysia marginata TaxID=1093978 RepID=A0AAV4EXU0_9GAST|nr:hypothetical protein ElyMa_001958200 [Elysia marginata]